MCGGSWRVPDGYPYWRHGRCPSPESDSRNFSEPYYQVLPPELTLLHPPPIGTVLPLTPLDALELQAALALPEEASCAALLRTAEFFGSRRRPSDGALELRVGVTEDAERIVLPSEPWPPPHAVLQRVAVACIVQAIVAPNDPSGAAAREFDSWLADADPELRLIRAWRARVARFATTRHDAAALAAYLMWKNPAGHHVESPLTRDSTNALVSSLSWAPSQPDGAQGVVDALASHAPKFHVDKLVDMLQRCYDLGDGCVVVGHRPPELAGELPSHLRRMWGRVPELVETGHLG